MMSLRLFGIRHQVLKVQGSVDSLQPAQGRGSQELNEGAVDQETGVLTPGQGKI